MYIRLRPPDEPGLVGVAGDSSALPCPGVEVVSVDGEDGNLKDGIFVKSTLALLFL